ncbi:DUF6211 family protein [Streptomyces jumonjinensis]|uniref:DUF6211 family protein n=1 Tax=Streptomyces jumonjinensis TaxID=1945 RepID=UPI0033335E5B
MVSETDRPHPRPGDLVRLTPGNSVGASPDETFVIVEDLPPSPEHLVLHLPEHHPDHPDWAAAVPPGELSTLTRLTSSGPRTWAPAPSPGTDA